MVSASRVRTPLLASLLPNVTVESLPVVWGKTLWGRASARCVVEQPNGLGIAESGYPGDAVVVATLGVSRVSDHNDGVDPPLPNAVALRGRLLQLKGVHPAIKRLDSSRFVLLFPCDPHRIVAVPPPPGIVAAPLGPGLAEYAGGVRFEVADELVESDLSAYAAAVADRMAEREGLT